MLPSLLVSLVLSFVGVDALFLNTPHPAHTNESTSLRKRFDDARFTFFDTGLGACGTTNQASDFIVALNAAQFGNGDKCYEMIEITYNGKTTQAQIVDECPGCPWGGLDFSRGLFDYFASEDLGVIHGSWVFAGDGDKSTPTAQKPTKAKPTPTTSSTSRPAEPTVTSVLRILSTTLSATSTNSVAAAIPSQTVVGTLEQLEQFLQFSAQIFVAGSLLDE
ncbi:RlpA-like double-psi beta-barrel-protein domain-containing protein-containing protein [Favolaschia claudopus]|uniref:RlpA-like double-psi beta-barrel-protein domain-containing protein-containing protein n=1 Tax=Favolaschia claudopus TaxID=2862362 RepID=A0AAW0ASC8_9AGAR